MSVCPLLTVFGFLPCRAATVSTSDVCFLLRFGFYLVLFLARTASASEADTILQNTLKVVFLTHRSMMEQSNTSKCHGDAVFVARHDHMVVANASACLGNKLYTTLMGTLDVVAEGEEGV